MGFSVRVCVSMRFCVSLGLGLGSCVFTSCSFGLEFVAWLLGLGFWRLWVRLSCLSMLLGLHCSKRLSHANDLPASGM